MKVLFLFSYNAGAISDFFTEICSRLVKDGHEVFVFSLKKTQARLSEEGVQIVIEKRGGYSSNYRKIFSFLKLINPDVAISNFSYVSPSLLAGNLLGINKNIVWSHTLKDQINPGVTKNFIKKKIYRLADVMIVNSKRLGQERSTLDGIKSSRIVEIPYWSNLDKVKPMPIFLDRGKDSFLIGCPGRITEDKNQLVLINAIAKVKDKFPKEIQIFFAGKGPYEEKLRAKVKSLNLENEVRFLGLLDSQEMVDFYKKMNVIVLPSLHESFGLVLIETLSLGLPVLVSNKFGALEFIAAGREKLDQITFDPENTIELAHKLTNIAGNKKLESSFYRDLYTQNFSKDIIYSKFLQVLER